jgi:subfamily B ATP-binding cassette protein MsbA
MAAATNTLKARIQRIAPYFAGTRRGFVLVVIGAIVSALTEPAIPALLKPLLDSPSS